MGVNNNEENDWTPPYMDEDSQEGVSEESVNEIEPVSWSKGKTGAVVITILFIGIIILFTVKSCSIQKKVENPTTSKNTEIMEVQGVSEEVTNNEDNVNENSENLSESEVSELVSESEISTEVFVETPTGDIKEATTDVNLVEVSEPSLGDIISTQGIVSGKKIYQIGNGYLYEARLIIITGNDENVICSYYCPRKTYDALTTGMSLKVDYQLDSTGRISISSISQ